MSSSEVTVFPTAVELFTKILAFGRRHIDDTFMEFKTNGNNATIITYDHKSNGSSGMYESASYYCRFDFSLTSTHEATVTATYQLNYESEKDEWSAQDQQCFGSCTLASDTNINKMCQILGRYSHLTYDKIDKMHVFNKDAVTVKYSMDSIRNL